jgi:hypothetical protein
MEVIKEDEWFNITINGETYKCLTHVHVSTIGHTRIWHELYISKRKTRKFLGVRWQEIEWQYENCMDNTELKSDQYRNIGNCWFYDIDFIKAWCQRAISSYHYEQAKKIKNKEKLKNVTHKKNITI